MPSARSPSDHWTLAAPSFVWPTGVAENCRRLQNMVDEVALLFLESQACLDYSTEDLPPWLASLGLRFHVHLPVDLPWASGPQAALKTVTALARKAAFLSPSGYVLHPPDDPSLFTDFYRGWVEAGFLGSELLIENIEGNDLSRLWPEIVTSQCSICLDVGHLLLFDQHWLLRQEELWSRLAMLHLYGIDSGHTHSSLSELPPDGQKILRGILSEMSPETVVVLETFSPWELQESLDIFSTWVRNWGLQ